MAGRISWATASSAMLLAFAVPAHACTDQDPSEFIFSCHQAAVGGAAADHILRIISGINDQAIEEALGLGGGGEDDGDADDDGGVGGAAAGPAGAPLFGIFASGQFARTWHDGYRISDGFTNIAGPSFTADDFSAAVSLDFNAAKHFGFDSEYGLNIGVFGGYASVDVEFNSFNGLSDFGGGRNESGMAGAYSLFRKGQSYLLVSGIGFFGETEVFTPDFGDVLGEYDTVGFAATASAGRIFVMSERWRFDLRGGILGVRFKGDSYVDTNSVSQGESVVSFGAVKFEPGIYGNYVLPNGMPFSPYVRGELQQRFGYVNKVSGAGQRFDFDDSDFSAALSAGFNLKVSDASTVSAEVRGKTSGDSDTLAAKIGLKVAF